jgi:3-hydroxypropanoate dehydrogenase
LARLANYDSSFYELLPRLFPAMPTMKDKFAKSPELAASTAKVDLEFFGTSAPGTGSAAGAFIAAGPVKSNFLCNLGYGDAAKLHPRGPHLEFDEACQML